MKNYQKVLENLNTATKKETRGGKRKGAGRKPAPYQTKTIAFRVRLEWVDVIKLAVKSKVAELSQNQNKIT